MPFPVLPDANVLVNAAVRDTLFRAAEYGLYQLVLSEAVLLEMRRALLSNIGLMDHRAAAYLSLGTM